LQLEKQASTREKGVLGGKDTKRSYCAVNIGKRILHKMVGTLQLGEKEVGHGGEEGVWMGSVAPAVAVDVKKTCIS